VMADPARMLMREDEVYVLDQGGETLYRYTLDENGAFQASGEGGLLLGPSSPASGVTIQEVTDLVWVEPGSGRETASLLVLVNGSSLLQVDGQGTATPVSVSGSDMWVEPRFLDTYSGYLYVLDAAEDRILKYAPTGSTYDSLPLEYFQDENPPDLEPARDMAIDGYIFILAGNSILKYSGGFREDFSVSGLEGQELSNPVAIFTSPDTQYLYAADPGLGRIVQLTKEGAFVRQFLPPRTDEGAFDGLRDLYVDEAGGRILALSVDAVYLAPLKQPPATIE
jgi:DNA-binding beta-propeller fold protein YncE